MFGRSSAAAVWVEVAGDAIHDSDWTNLPGDLGTQIRSFQGRGRFEWPGAVAIHGNNDVCGSAHTGQLMLYRSRLLLQDNERLLILGAPSRVFSGGTLPCSLWQNIGFLHSLQQSFHLPIFTYTILAETSNTSIEFWAVVLVMLLQS